MATSTIVRRNYASPIPIGRHKETIMIDVSVNDTTATADIQLNGTITHIFVVAPDLDGASGTYVFSIEDEDNDEYYNSGNLNENSTSFLDVDRSVCGTITLKIVTTDAQSTDKSFTVKIIYT